MPTSRPSTPPSTAAGPAGAPAPRPGAEAAPQPRARLFVATLFVDGGRELEAPALALDVSALRRAGIAAPVLTSLIRAVRIRLEAVGAIDLRTLDDCEGLPGVDVDYVLGLDEDVDAVCGLTASVLAELRAAGWTVDVDPRYPWQVVGADAPLVMGARWDRQRPDWFNLELGIEVDGHQVDLLPALLEWIEDLEDLDELPRLRRRTVAVKVGDRQWLPVPGERLRGILAVLIELYRGRTGPVPRSQAPLLASLGAALYAVERPVAWVGERALRDSAYALALGPSERGADRFQPPTGLRAELRPYQRDGVAWLRHLRAHGAGGVLADDMGLGKTLQVIAHLLGEREAGRAEGPSLVVTLTSVVGNWGRELARFAPSLKVVTWYGPRRAELEAELAGADVVVTTYPLLLRDRERLGATPWDTVVLDEAHAIKTVGAQVRDAACALPARHRICLSGTPIENHLGELWSILDFLSPGLLGSADEFRTSFRDPIEQLGDAGRVAALREQVRPFVLRRTKEKVATELPAKTELVRTVELTGAQRELYESIRLAAHADVRAHIKQRGVGGATVAILDALLQLRQVCCDPRLARLARAQPGEPPASAKLELLLELLTGQVEAGRRILVFSQFARMIALISEALLARGVRHVSLTGATGDRQRPIDAFQSGKADVFLISLRAGGTGLNLTRADTVIHYDPWWNPAVQAQATDRAHRIGQERPVFVYNLVAAGSVEERMLGLQKQKRALSAAVLGDPQAARPLLTTDLVDDLFAPLAS